MGHEVDVVIVGGGWTGVSTALAFEKHNAAFPDKPVRYVLLEGHADRLGGRAYSYPYTWKDADGNEQTTHFEHGAQYIGKEQTAIWTVVQQAIELGLIDANDLVDGFAARYPYKTQVMMVAGKRYQYDRDNCLFGIGGVPPDLNLWDLIGSLIYIQAVEAFEQAINVLEPWKSPKFVTELDKVTMSEWIDSFALPPGARSLMKVSVEAVLSVQPEEISAFYFFWYCACNGGFLNEVNDENDGPQQYYLACGIDTLIDKLVANYRDKISFGEVVQSVAYGDDGVTVTTSKGVHTGKRVVMATSPASAHEVSFEPALPTAWQSVLDQPMGITLKCQVFYKTPWWRNVSESADPQKEGVPQYTGYCGANDYPVIWVMDYSPVGPPPAYADQGCYCLMTFTIGNEAKALGDNPTKEDFVKLVTEGICNLMNDTRALSTSDEYMDLLFFEWNPQTPLIPGGPNTVFPPGVLTGSSAPAKAFDEPVADRVYFACAELARKRMEERTSPLPIFLPNWKDLGATGLYSDWRQSLGYMDGAITCGDYVAEQVLADLGLGEKPSIGDRVIGWAEELVAEAEADLQNLFVDPTGGSAPPVDQAKVVAVMTTLSELLYAGSALKIDHWQATEWKSDAEALQNWVTGVLVAALVKNGLVDAPPKAPSPGFGVIQAVLYMIQMAGWSAKFLNAAVAFTQAGYQYFDEFTPSRDPYGPYEFSEVVELTKLANALMGLKSAEPFQVGDDKAEHQEAPTSGRFMSMATHFRNLPTFE